MIAEYGCLRGDGARRAAVTPQMRTGHQQRKAIARHIEEQIDAGYLRFMAATP